MKKQYIFLIIIWIILYISYLIIGFTIKEYKINSNIEYITELNQTIKEKIKEAEKIITYKSSSAYKNKVLKEQQSFKNKWEDVIYLTTEKIYNKFTAEIKPLEVVNVETNKDKVLNEKTIYEKWIYLIYNKDSN